MKNTSLHDTHRALGAKIIPFAGFNMPVQYAGVTKEHQTVREGVGVFDVSHMGEFFVKGPHALDLLQKVTSNNVANLQVGKAQYSCLPNATGGIVDDLLVYRLQEEAYLLVVNASNIEKDWKWIESQNTDGAVLENLSDAYSLLAIQGPKAAAAMQSLSDVALADIPFYSFEMGTFAGTDNVLISATGYTGSGGFEIYCKNEDVLQIWNRVLEAGAAFDIQPIGLAARDTLRLEMGYCLYGNDIDDSTSPLEAGLGWITKFSKKFTNSEALLKQKESGVSKKLIGFELLDKGVPRHGYEITDVEGKPIGRVTSGTMGPTVKKGIGMGYVPSAFSKVGSEICIRVRKRLLKAQVVKTPFYKN
jgi:aminomethyltransferase